MQSDPQPLFRALADPTRRDILMMLRGTEMSIGQVAAHFDITRAAVKKHLTVLTDGGLVTVETRGREKINRLDPSAMGPLRDWLSYFDQFWDDRLATLKGIVEKDAKS